MEVKRYPIEGLVLLTPKVFGDHRGFFMETYNKQSFADAGITLEFVQDNHSKSHKGILRGLHYQVKHPQAKLVRCLQGEIYDVAVDIRPGSPTFGQWVGEILSSENKRQLMVPMGFAHGFQVLSETAEVAYKCNNLYSPANERGICYNDPDLAISWPGGSDVVLSEKDTRNPCLKDINMQELIGV